MTKQIKVIQQGLRRRMHSSLEEILCWLKKVIQGHFNYYGVPGNSKQLAGFKDEVVRRLLKILRRRSQRSKLRWDRFGPFINKVLPSPRVLHEYPEARFRAKHSR